MIFYSLNPDLCLSLLDLVGHESYEFFSCVELVCQYLLNSCAGEGKHPKLLERQCCLRFVAAPPADRRLDATTEWKQDDRKSRAEKRAVPSVSEEADRMEEGRKKGQEGKKGRRGVGVGGHRKKVAAILPCVATGRVQCCKQATPLWLR